ncbi:C-reactive protein-like [Xenopus laevis]|uniref:Pentraxin family member n=2 Tax=Xenopus laevis TaxID=8355 RepID=A0A974H8T5_XENLA|nr:C-reactive protein-like [Xenopus laevis]OCT69019.1 hypothetical protein XELAEV_18040327mg [Xenopus laevis]
MEAIWLCVVFLTGSLAQQDMGRNVFLFPKETSTSYVILKPSVVKSLDKLTLCLQSYSDLTRSYPLFSVATTGSGNYNTFVIVSSPSKAYYVYVDNEETMISTGAEVLDWKHTCVTWDSETGIIQLWLNGKLFPRKISKKGFTINEKTSIILGQEQDNFGGGFDPKQSFVGEMSDVNLWDYVLTPPDIEKLLLNSKDVTGNIISWKSLNYESKGGVFLDLKLQCKSWTYMFNSYHQC